MVENIIIEEEIRDVGDILPVLLTRIEMWQVDPSLDCDNDTGNPRIDGLYDVGDMFLKKAIEEHGFDYIKKCMAEKVGRDSHLLSKYIDYLASISIAYIRAMEKSDGVKAGSYSNSFCNILLEKDKRLLGLLTN